MNIYGKLAEARAQFHALKLKKTGKNKFAGYEYFELADFVIPGMKCLKDNGLVPVVSFTESIAMMSVHSIDGDGMVVISSPMSTANLKGCHPIQNVGAVETYQRRYLWMALMEIVEHDALDSSAPVEDKPMPKLASKEQKAIIHDYKEAEILSPRRKSWCAKNWDAMTEEQAQTIIDECKQLEAA